SCGSGGCGTCAVRLSSRATFCELEEARERLRRRSHRGELSRRESAESARKPRGAAGANAAKRALAVLCQCQSDAAPVGLAPRARDEAGALEPRDALRHRGGRDALFRGELANGDARRV